MCITMVRSRWGTRMQCLASPFYLHKGNEVIIHKYMHTYIFPDL